MALRTTNASLPRKPVSSTTHPRTQNGEASSSSPVAPSTSSEDVRRFEQPDMRLQETPASPVHISPPRHGILDAEAASIREASIRDNESRRSSRGLHTPDSAKYGIATSTSADSLPIRARLPSGGLRLVSETQGYRESHSRGSSVSNPRIEEEDFGGELPPPPPEHGDTGLQYHAFDEAPKKKLQKQNRTSHGTTASAGSSSSGGDNRYSQNLGVPRPNQARPMSSNSELRGRTLSPLSANGDDSGSPLLQGRDQSNSRRSPASRPVSYVDLLASVPYSQQVAPGPSTNHAGLQSVVGNAASLLDTKKTLEMYRANVKKTNDAAVQYEFAIFMINAAKDADPQRDGLSPTELISEAKDILQRLADRAYPFAQYYLGDGYFSGLFNKDKPNHDKAFHLFVGAAKHGHAEASYRAALCYEFGWGTTKGYQKAVQYYRQAASKNHPGAATRLGMACLTGDMGLTNHQKEGVKWLKRAQESADTQYNTAPYELGMMHMTGYRDFIFKDEGYAAQLLTQAAELGHVKANFMMGQAYENGWYGLPKDGALSVHFYNGAASRGMPDAMMALCAWYMMGAEPVLEKDEGEAYAWAKQAAELGLAKAEYAIGYFTEMGIGCRRDPLEANVWYVRAADQGNETAKQRLHIIRQAASGGDAGMPMAKADPKSKDLAGNGGGKKKILGIF